MIMKKPLLTISLLASDRPKELRRCLDSLKPITEKLSCELILIDTSKNPVVNQILREYTNQVYPFEWCKDFAKARNEGLKRAKGEWFMYLDDDEWFMESDAIIEFFCSGEYKKYSYANYQVRNFLDSKYENYSDAWVSRLVRIEENTRFVSKIHEYFTTSQDGCKYLTALVGHSGYIYETPEAKQAHFERNTSLLLEMIKEEPDNIRWKEQLAQEYSSNGAWELLEKHCKDTLSLLSKVKEPEINKYIGTYYVGLAVALINLKQYEESKEICQKALVDRRSCKLLKAYMHLKLGESYYRMGSWDKALEQIDIYLKMLETTDVRSKEIVEESTVLLVGEALENMCQRIAYSILIAANLQKNRTQELHEHYEKLGWDQEIIRGFEDVEKAFVKAMWKLNYDPIFAEIIIDTFKNPKWRELFCEEIQRTLRDASQGAEDETEGLTLQFRESLAWFVLSMQKVAAGVQNDDLLGYETALSDYIQATCQWYDFMQEQGLTARLGEENPDYIEAALYISDYFETKETDVISALGLLKGAVEAFPTFAEGIGSFIHNYSDLETQRIAKQNEEMEALRVQVVGQVKAMLAAGQKEAAMQIIGQLKMMFPNDPEVNGL